MLIQFSPKLTPTTSSAAKAWPIWAPKLRTPGMARSSLLARVVMRCISGQRRAGNGDPVHQEVALLERRQQRVPEQRPNGDPASVTTPTVT